MKNFKYEIKQFSSNSIIIDVNDNEDELKEKEEKKRLQQRKFNFTPFEAINYSKFDEMRKYLDEYFTQLYKSVRDNSKIESEVFKKPFFSSLENLLIQICLLKDQKLKVNKIDDVYKWFNKKWKFHLNTKNIDRKTKKTHFEKYHLTENYKKNDYKEVNENNAESHHRTKIDEIESLKFK